MLVPVLEMLIKLPTNSRMPSHTLSWQDALKAHAEKTGRYVIPKKGTDEYEAVRKLMGSDPMVKKERKRARSVSSSPEPMPAKRR